MIRNTHPIHFVLSVSVVVALLAAGGAHAGRPAEVYPRLIEAFTTTELPVTGDAAINRNAVHREMELHIYELDGIQCIEANLSEGLSADPEQSKRIVLQRIQHLNEADRAQMQRAAMGLAKAVQYGIDRYPAVVFDSEVVIYGVTEIREALHRYKQWRQGGKR